MSLHLARLNSTECEPVSTFHLSAHDDLAIYNSLVHEWAMGGWYIQHVIRRGRDLTAREAEDVVRAMGMAVQLQDAIKAYCGEDVFIHSRDDAITRWKDRVRRSNNASREGLLQSSDRLLRVSPLVPSRDFTETRTIALDKHYVEIIRDALYHQWFRGIGDLRHLMRNIIEGIGYWRKADNGMFGYGAITGRLKDLLVLRRALEALFRCCPTIEMFPGDAVLWFDAIMAGVTDATIQSRVISDLGSLLAGLPTELSGLGDIAEQEECEDFM